MSGSSCARELFARQKSCWAKGIQALAVHRKCVQAGMARYYFLREGQDVLSGRAFGEKWIYLYGGLKLLQRRQEHRATRLNTRCKVCKLTRRACSSVSQLTP